MRRQNPSDLSAFEEFYRREYPRLAGSLQMACGSRDLAEELAQEAFARALNHWPRVSAMERQAGWLYRVGFNLLRRDWKLRGRTYALNEVPPTTSNGDERADLVHALSKLSYEQASAVVLRHVLDYPTDEVARMLELKPGALRMLLHRAIKTLRQDTNLQLSEED